MRLFLGISIDLEALPVLQESLKKLRTSADRRNFDVKWSPKSNLHVTLKFLGEASENRIEEISNALGSLGERQGPLILTFEGMGGFPDVDETRVIWAGVKRKKELMAFQARVEERTKALGFADDQFDYLPHMTLGRLRNAKNIRELISPWVRKSFGRVEADSVVLFQSVIQGNVSKYIPLREVARLRGSS